MMTAAKKILTSSAAPQSPAELHHGINAEVVSIELPGQGQNDLIACLCAWLRVSQSPPLYTALRSPNETACHAMRNAQRKCTLRVSECLASTGVAGCKRLRHPQPESEKLAAGSVVVVGK